MNAIVLAAGNASRFGVPKALLPAGEGATLLSRVVGLALGAVTGRVVVVLGREAELAAHALQGTLTPPSRERVRHVVNQDYQHGLSSSLKVGLAALPEDAVLVLLADQPAVSAAQLEALVAAYQKGAHVAVAAAEGGEQRTPVILGPALRDELRRLQGDTGARKVLARYGERVGRLEWGNGPWLTDVDTWEAYRALALGQGWHREATPYLPVVEGLPEGMWEAARTALSHTPAPLLTPTTLIVSYPVPAALYQTTAQTTAGSLANITGVAAGEGDSPEAYLSLLRRAALTLLTTLLTV